MLSSYHGHVHLVRLLLSHGADPDLGEPSAIQACQIFRQEEFEAMFKEQVEKLRAEGRSGGEARVNGGS